MSKFNNAQEEQKSTFPPRKEKRAPEGHLEGEWRRMLFCERA